MTARSLRYTAGLATALAAIAALAGGLGVLAPPTPAQAQGSKDELKGKWTAVSFAEGGKSMLGAKAITLDFQGDRVTLGILDKRQKGFLRVDATRSPKQFEWWMEGVVHISQGIYKVEKDVLTVCFAEGLRPLTFDSRGLNPTTLLVLKRGEVKLTPAEEQQLREEIQDNAWRTFSRNNLLQFALAMHNFHDAHKRFPPLAILSKDGKPLLSWRVAILPYIDHAALYRQFKLDEPWDSAHNKKLLGQMPPHIFLPEGIKTKEPHTTYYQMFVGLDAWPIQPKPGTLFNTDGLRIRTSFKNGASNTIMIVEAGEAVPWTKPADLTYDAKKPLPKLGGLFKDGFHAAFGDGSVRFLRGTDEKTLRLLINPKSTDPIDPAKIK